MNDASLHMVSWRMPPEPGSMPSRLGDTALGSSVPSPYEHPSVHPATCMVPQGGCWVHVRPRNTFGHPFGRPGRPDRMVDRTPYGSRSLLPGSGSSVGRQVDGKVSFGPSLVGGITVFKPGTASMADAWMNGNTVDQLCRPILGMADATK